MTIDENTVAIVSFEGHIKRTARHVHEALDHANIGDSWHLEINLRGSHGESGTIKIQYTLHNSYVYDAREIKVVGNSLDAVVEEFLRRHGWNAHHAPLQIPSHNFTSDE